MTNGRELLEAYLNGETLNEQQRAALSQWVCESAENAALATELTHLNETIRHRLKSDSLGPLLDNHESGIFEDALHEDKPASQALNELARLEKQAETMTVTLHDGSDWKDPGLSSGQWHGALAYVYEHSFTRRRVVTFAAAAAILLGVALAIVYLPGEEGPSNLTEVPDFVTPIPDANRVVATITEQHKAQWVTSNGRGPLPERTLLGPNQRLTLAEGFAELTTVHGAQVLVQAPATFETTDSDNAIRLHRGKLVGRCDTPASKGFIVHAPGMDIVDLSTSFGVEAGDDGTSTVLVIEGSVRAQPTEQSPNAFEPVVLKKNQARRTVALTGSLEMIAVSESPVFHPEPIHPYVAAVLESQPLAYWRFEDGASNTVTNEMNPGQKDLRLSGAARIAEGGFLGHAGHIDAGQQPLGSFDMQGFLKEASDRDQFTFACWFRAEDIRQATLLSLYEPDPTEIKHIVYLELQSDLSRGIEQSIRAVHCNPPNIAGSEGTNVFSDKTYQPEVWQHVVVVKTIDHLRLYLDGQLVGDIETDRDIADDARISLGLNHKTAKPELGATLTELARPLNGWIDEASIYDRALTEDEIKKHWQAGRESGTRS